MWNCRICSSENEDDTDVCSECGSWKEEDYDAYAYAQDLEEDS